MDAELSRELRAVAMRMGNYRFAQGQAREQGKHDEADQYAEEADKAWRELCALTTPALGVKAAPASWQEWLRPDHIRLHAGELTAQEMRTVLAVVRAMLAEAAPGVEGLPPEMHREIELAWNDLPDAIRAHPGVKRLYRACGVDVPHGAKENNDGR